MNPEIEYNQLVGQRIGNLFQTFILLVAMVSLVILVGYFFAGTIGLVWAAVLGFALLSVSIKLSPAIILRLYRAQPLSPVQAPELHRLNFELARRAKLTTAPRLYYVPSSTFNAFAVGTRENAHVGLTDGLLRLLNARELTGVLAHELSHIRNNDIRVMGMADMLTRVTSVFSTFGQLLLLINLPLFLIDGATIPWLAILILIAAPTLNALLQLALSRTREFNADISAVHLTGDPEGLASALEKMEIYLASPLTRIFLPDRSNPDPSLLRTHPATQERIRRLRSLIKRSRPSLPPELYTFLLAPPHVRPVTRRPRWHIGGLWH